MAIRDDSKCVHPDGVGSGVFNPKDFQIFNPKDETVIGVYRDGIDIRHVIVRNFEPGQENGLHTHPENAHCIYVLEGSGEVFYRDEGPFPLTAGQIWIVPRSKEHGIRNTGSPRLSYLGVTAGKEPETGGAG